MPKSQPEKSSKRVLAFASANLVEWQRLIENPDLTSEVKKLQRYYGLPIIVSSGVTHISAREVNEWMGWNEPIKADKKTGELIVGPKYQRRKKLAGELQELMVRFGLPSKFYEALHHMVVLDIRSPIVSSTDFPTFNTRKDKNGTWVEECIITPETDLKNQLVLDMILRWQTSHRDKIPEPQHVRDHATRLDWRPVWEWKKRHPNVSDREIAKRLGKDRVAVSRALEKLDKEYLLQI